MVACLLRVTQELKMKNNCIINRAQVVKENLHHQFTMTTIILDSFKSFNISKVKKKL